MSKNSVCAIICAAGKGLRAGFEKNKLLIPFAGSTVLEKTISAFDFPAIDEIIVTASEVDFAEISALCEKYARTSVVLGGEDRSHSVYNALKSAKSDIVLIHDGARPFVTRAIIEGCVESVKAYGSGVCAVECRDTIAVCKDGKILSVPARDSLRRRKAFIGKTSPTLTNARLRVKRRAIRTIRPSLRTTAARPEFARVHAKI